MKVSYQVYPMQDKELKMQYGEVGNYKPKKRTEIEISKMERPYEKMLLIGEREYQVLKNQRFTDIDPRPWQGAELIGDEGGDDDDDDDDVVGGGEGGGGGRCEGGG